MNARRRAWLALAIVLGLTTVALARPGGGDSYSGGGGHGGGGGDSGVILELIYWTLRLCLYYPYIGVPILVMIIAWVIHSAYRQQQNKDWDSGPGAAVSHAVDLSAIRELDPEFSQVVFEDFAFRLFSTAHRARGTADTLATVAPYVSPAARQALAEREPVGEPVVQVIVGAMRAVRVDAPIEPLATASVPLDGRPSPRPARTRIELEFEANVATATHTYFSVETWLFGRDAGRTSKPPGVSRTFPCPNCGAPWQATATGTQQCASCNEIVDNGRFDWGVETISLASIDERPPTLTTEVPERGTDLDTYRQDDVDAELEQLNTDDPAVTEAALQTRLRMIYDQLGKAWSNNDVAPVRGLVSDGLYDYLAYWIDAYKRQGLRNQLTDMRITRTEVAKLVRDRWYHAITIRLWGTGKDFVVRSMTGEVVRGSKHRERPYSEYWTLIRSAQRKGPPKATAACGNCGAPLAVTQAGACEHCGAHVTAGEFDWMLSKIEQDDSYRG